MTLPASPANSAGPTYTRGVALDPGLIEAGRVLFAGPCSFVRPVDTLVDLPPPVLPELCFAGRSNVGKSSLINALTGRNTLARASNTPGRTRALNYFRLADRAFLVDLPGYGYAKVSKSEAAQWTRLFKAYLRGRASLKRAVLLVDSRHGLKDSDARLLALMDEAAVSYQVVLTKADKIRAKDLVTVMDTTEAALRRHAAAHPLLIATSAETGAGIPELRAALCGALDHKL